LLAAINTFSQKHDYNILVGYRTNDTIFNSYRGITQLNFNTPSLNPEILYDSFKIMNFDWTVNNMSNADGDYIFSYNGLFIQDSSNHIMQNANGGFTRQTSTGDVVYQSGLILPLKRKDNYVLIHEFHYIHPEYNTYFSDGLNYSIIDMTKNNGRGLVVLKNKSVLKDTLDYGRLLAIKHANGRDWWILVGRHDMESYYTFLLSNDIIYQYGVQKIGDHQYIPFGCVAVSQQGDKIVYVSQHEGAILGQGGVLGLFLHFFDFDRCTGLLSNPKSVQIDNRKTLLMGGAFSPNGKYFYLSRIETIYQIDMTRSDFVLDTVANYDGFKYVSSGNFEYHTWFGFIQPAPDGRIYGSTSSSTQEYLFYINKPDVKGRDCDVRQHAIKITAHEAIPSFPNYRLGPIDGSSCDTLGINNLPVAEFRYNQDSSQYLKMEFTDLSYYEPKEWHWNYGDISSMNNISTQANPTHIFSENGLFDVCLIVKNNNGSDTICKIVNLGTVGTESKIKFLPKINISPNPFKDYFVVNVVDYLPQKMFLQFYNSLGEPVLFHNLYQGSNFMNLDDLNPGLYLISVIENGKVIMTDKLIKI
jgi:hypothetical protein